MKKDKKEDTEENKREELEGQKENKIENLMAEKYQDYHDEQMEIRSYVEKQKNFCDVAIQIDTKKHCVTLYERKKI